MSTNPPGSKLSPRVSLPIAATIAAVALVSAGVWYGLPSQETMPSPRTTDLNPLASRTDTPAEESSKISTLLSADPEQVQSSAVTLPPSPFLQARIETAISLAQRSPLESLTWAKSLQANERTATVIAAATEVARTHPAEALSALVELEASRDRDAVLTHAASQWASLDPNAAMDWAARGAAGDLREQLCSAVAIGLADRDPRVATDFVAMQMGDGVSLRTAAVAVAQRWAKNDASAARAWVEKFPAGSMRDDAFLDIEVQRNLAAGK